MRLINSVAANSGGSLYSCGGYRQTFYQLNTHSITLLSFHLILPMDNFSIISQQMCAHLYFILFCTFWRMWNIHKLILKPHEAEGSTSFSSFFLVETKENSSIEKLRMRFCIEERRAGWLGEEGEIFWVLRAMISVNRAIPLPLSSCGLDNLSLPCQQGMVPPDKKSLHHILAYPDFWFTVTYFADCHYGKLILKLFKWETVVFRTGLAPLMDDLHWKWWILVVCFLHHAQGSECQF